MVINMKTGFAKLACLLIVSIAMGITARAAEANNIGEPVKKNSVLQINSDAQLHEESNESSAVTSALPAGTPVVIMEDEKDGWCKVSYHENEGYVQISVLGVLGSPIAPDLQNVQENAKDADARNTENGENKTVNNVDALNSEFANAKEEVIQAYQEAEQANEQLAEGILWKVVIAVLVVAIFAVGIASKLRGNNGNSGKR